MTQLQIRERASRQLRMALGAVVGLSLLFSPQISPATELVSGFGDNPGNLAMYLHRPGNAVPGLPLVVALHGCTQGASTFDDETGLLALAEELPFVLLLPEQREENMSRRCFRWYDANDNRPGRGESASILAMIDRVIDTERVDPDKVFVLGLSAGGAMAAVLMANYPDRFAGGAILAGLPYGCNRPVSIFDATWYWLHWNPFAADGADASYACGIVGFRPTDRDAADWAELIRDVAPANPDHWPLVSLWQGTGDTTVDPGNLRELTEQWTAMQGIDAIADDRETVGDAVRELYFDESGSVRVETWSLKDFSRAVPIDADGDPQTCGIQADFVLDARCCQTNSNRSLKGQDG